MFRGETVACPEDSALYRPRANVSNLTASRTTLPQPLQTVCVHILRDDAWQWNMARKARRTGFVAGFAKIQTDWALTT